PHEIAKTQVSFGTNAVFVTTRQAADDVLIAGSTAGGDVIAGDAANNGAATPSRAALTSQRISNKKINNNRRATEHALDFVIALVELAAEALLAQVRDAPAPGNKARHPFRILRIRLAERMDQFCFFGACLSGINE